MNEEWGFREQMFDIDGVKVFRAVMWEGDRVIWITDEELQMYGDALSSGMDTRQISTMGRTMVRRLHPYRATVLV